MGERDAEDHDGGLAGDLELIGAGLIERRRALSWLGAVAGSAAPGIASLLFPRRARASGSCVADAPETAGPYPADGTNRSNGATSDVLTESGVVRKDVSSSFLTSTTRAKGVKVKLELTLVDTNAGCTPLSGYAVYLWHCDRDGHYSLYSAPDESYLRGVQVSDDRGRLSFVTIFPACYPGRWPHVHLENFTSLAEATNGKKSFLTTQLALPADICAEVYDNARGYSGSIAFFSAISLSTDPVFRDDTPAQLAAMTPKMKGNIVDGYVARATVGIAA